MCLWVCVDVVHIVSVFNHILKKKPACFETFLFCEAIWKENEKRGKERSKVKRSGDIRTKRGISTCEGLDTDINSAANVIKKTLKI